MTVSTSANRADYNGNGASTSFSVPFYFPDPTTLLVLSTVIATGVSTTLVLNSDYTVTGAGVATGGTVTTTVAVPAGNRLSILLNLAYLQQTHYVPNDPFPAASHEAALDYLTLLAKQTAEVSSRSVQVPAGESGSSVVLPPAPARAGFLLGFDANGAIALIAAAAQSASALALSLLSSAGASLVTFLQAGTGAVARTIQSVLRQWPSALDFNAIGDGVTDDTAAMTAAQVASPFVYLPAGKTFKVTSAINYWQFYGPGAIFRAGETYAPTAFPRTGAVVVGYNTMTFGSYENAVAGSFTVNNGTGQLKTSTQVNGTSGSGYATPVGQQRDHVALFFSGAPGARVFCSTDATYTSTTMTAAAIGVAGAAGIKPGMIVDTLHATPYTGTVQSINGSTITVDAWWLNGASPTAGTPANATGAVINPTTVTFGANGVVSTTSFGGDAATGLEIDVFAQNATGANASTAFDAVGLGSFTALAAHRARSNWQIGFYSQGSGVASGFVADTNGTGFEARDVTGNGFQSRKSGIVKWCVNALGLLQADYRSTAFNASATYSVGVNDAVVVNVSGGAVITLPAASAALANKHVTVNASAGCTVKNQAAATIKTLATGTSAIFSCDGSFWY